MKLKEWKDERWETKDMKINGLHLWPFMGSQNCWYSLCLNRVWHLCCRTIGPKTEICKALLLVLTGSWLKCSVSEHLSCQLFNPVLSSGCLPDIRSQRLRTPIYETNWTWKKRNVQKVGFKFCVFPPQGSYTLNVYMLWLNLLTACKDHISVALKYVIAVQEF